MNEKQFKKTLVKKLRNAGYTIFDTDIMSSVYAGFPDLIIVKGNRTVYAELKLKYGAFTKAQIMFYRKYPTLPITHFRFFDKTSYDEIIKSLKEWF